MAQVWTKVTTTAQALDKGAIDFIEAHRGHGRRRATILTELRKRYPSMKQPSIEATYNLVVGARREGRKLASSAPADKISCTGLNRPTGVKAGCTYYVAIPYTDIVTGRVSFRTIRVPSDRKLTLQEIIAKGTQSYFEADATLPGGAGKEQRKNYFTHSAYLYSVFPGEL